jgi:hypothetical protein
VNRRAAISILRGDAEFRLRKADAWSRPTALLSMRWSRTLKTKKEDVIWFVPNDDRPLFAFASIWTEFKGERGTKSKPIPPALTSFTAS